MSASLVMFDNVNVSLLPAGYDAYAAYIDGYYRNFTQVKTRFPNAHILSIDVFASDPRADCLDIEPGDATNAAAAGWVKAKIDRKDPLIVLYTSVSNVDALVYTMTSHGIPRAVYKLWSAHYGHGKHICGPASCGQTRNECDGTQFTDSAFGHSLDESILSDGFFASSAPAGPQRHVADGSLSLDEIAAKAGENPESIVRTSFSKMNDAHKLDMAVYLVAQGRASKTPAGLVYWTAA